MGKSLLFKILLGTVFAINFSNIIGQCLDCCQADDDFVLDHPCCTDLYPGDGGYGYETGNPER